MHFPTIVDTIAHWAEKTPDKTCLIEGETGRSCTYSELWRWARIFSEKLKVVISPGDRVVTRTGGLLESFTAEFGTFLAGGVYCPLEQHMQPLKLQEMLAYFDAGALISDERIDTDVAFFDLNEVIDREGFPTGDVTRPNPEDIGVIIFTTGTTGKAKGVVRTHRSISTAMFYATESFGGLESADTLMWITPLKAIGIIYWPTLVFQVGGTALHMQGIVFTTDFLETIRKYNVTILHIQSYAASILLKNASETMAKYMCRLRIIFLAGGILAEKDKLFLRDELPNTRLLNVYGMTESNIAAFYELPRDNASYKPFCIGKSLYQFEIILTDEDGNDIGNCTRANPGIVAIDSELIMTGYWKAPELTESAIKNGRLITTDIGYKDDDGDAYVLGRRDDVIVSGGHKIAPYEIEDIAMQFDGVAECICIGVKHDVIAHVPKLFVKMHTGYECNVKAMYQFLTERLEKFKLPRSIIEVDDFPRVDGSLKIDRRALRDEV